MRVSRAARWLCPIDDRATRRGEIRLSWKLPRPSVHQEGQESKTELGDLDDLDGKFDGAVAEMLEDWEENRRRYLNG
jgi:hypothetical protein